MTTPTASPAATTFTGKLTVIRRLAGAPIEREPDVRAVRRERRAAMTVLRRLGDEAVYRRLPDGRHQIADCYGGEGKLDLYHGDTLEIAIKAVKVGRRRPRA